MSRSPFLPLATVSVAPAEPRRRRSGPPGPNRTLNPQDLLLISRGRSGGTTPRGTGPVHRALGADEVTVVGHDLRPRGPHSHRAALLPRHPARTAGDQHLRRHADTAAAVHGDLAATRPPLAAAVSALRKLPSGRGTYLVPLTVIALTAGSRRAHVRGALLGAATAAKFLPAATVPGALSGILAREAVSVRRRVGVVAVVLLSAGAVVGLAYLPYLLTSRAPVLGYLSDYVAEEGYDDASAANRYTVLRLFLPE